MKRLYILVIVTLGFAACKPNIEPQAPSAGDVDVSSYLAVGSSSTAGYMDGSLYKEGQENSFPVLLNRQFSQVVYIETFKQPMLKAEYGYPNPKLIFKSTKWFCEETYRLATIIFPGAIDTAGASATLQPTGPFNNVGTPGIRCVDYPVAGYGAKNPYSLRFYTDPATKRPIDEAGRLGHTFFTLWGGNNDVLDYARLGGEGSPIPLSDYNAFSVAFDTILSNLTRHDAKGVVLNIPDIAALPYFNTIPPNGLVLTKNGADTLNDFHNNTDMRFNEGNSYFVIEDTTRPIKMRQAMAGEMILLSLPPDSVRCAGWGSRKPIPARYVLTKNEVDKIVAATDFFNEIMAQKAASYQLPLVDIFSFVKTLETGVKYNGVTTNANYINGGVYSLDGIHFTPRGNAILANKIIATMNDNFNSTIPFIDVNSYRGILIP